MIDFESAAALRQDLETVLDETATIADYQLVPVTGSIQGILDFYADEAANSDAHADEIEALHESIQVVNVGTPVN